MSNLLYLTIIGGEIWIAFFLYQKRSYFNKLQRIIIFLGYSYLVLFELIGLGKIPGLFIDERFTFYDSWSLANYGIDSNFLHNPIYSISSGGQSIFYTQIARLFLKVFGMNLAAFRYPMALLVIVSIGMLLYALSKNNIKPVIIVGITVAFVTAKWLLMFGRWGMDCNIEIPMFIFAFSFTLLALSGSKYNGYLALSIVSLIAYCYVGVWIVLPIIYGVIVYFLYKNKKFVFKDIIYTSIINLIILLPIFSYICVQFLNLKPFRFIIFDVVKLPATRVESSMIDFKSNLFNNIAKNIIEGIDQIVKGNDPWLHNSIPKYEMYSLISFIIMIFGLLYAKKYANNKDVVELVKYLSFSMIPLLCFVIPNYNHWALILIIYTLWFGFGLGILFEKKWKFKLLGIIIKVSICLIICFTSYSFTRYYFTDYLYDEVAANQLPKPNSIVDYSEAKKFLEQLDKLNVKTYYGVPLSHVYEVGDTVGLVETVKPVSPQNIQKLLNKYQFNLPNEIQPGSAVYIVPVEKIAEYPNFEKLPSKIVKFNGVKYILYINK